MAWPPRARAFLRQFVVEKQTNGRYNEYMRTIDIAGLKVTATNKAELLDELAVRLKRKQQTVIFTPYSEFLYNAFQNAELLKLYNGADFNLPDGIGIFWAARYLTIPLNTKNRPVRWMVAWWQALYSLVLILLWPPYVRRALDTPFQDGNREKPAAHHLDASEKISGSELIWDLAGLAERDNFSIFLFGGLKDTAARVATKLQTKLPQLRIAGWSNKNASDPSVIEDINRLRPDMLLVALGPTKQERWIIEHAPVLTTSLAIGLGGTFDYLAGNRWSPPHFLRNMGLEWLFRLLTQPGYRLRRVFHATAGLVTQLVRYKVLKKTLANGRI